MSDWAPARYFDWTPQSQSVLIVSIVVTIAMMILCFLRPSPHMFAGFGVLVMLISQMHFGDSSASLNIFSSAALLMCLYAVMQESWRMAYLDELTELPGRRALREKFQKLSGLYTVAMLDVDHFKKFNDSYGHDTGDAVLRMIAAKMNKVTGGGASYRYGGEEFSVVFTGKSASDAAPHLEALREAIANAPFVINRASRRKNEKNVKQNKNQSVTVTVSIGVADSNGDADSPWDVLKLSDKALYRAKGKGRNCVCSASN
jgi:diguanylate cyclase (GGDEF)-like protein